MHDNGRKRAYWDGSDTHPTTLQQVRGGGLAGVRL
jgi:hypothetical protein